MNRVLHLIFVLLFLTGCDKTINIGSLSLGQSKNEVENVIKDSYAENKSEWNNTIRLYNGDLSLLGIKWDTVDCKFSEDRLVAVTMMKKLSQTPDFEIQCVKSKLRDLCGDGYSKGLTAGYGMSHRNNGCLGGINADIEDDNFFAMIHLPGYGPND